MTRPEIVTDCGLLVIYSPMTKITIELTSLEAQWLSSPKGTAALRAALGQLAIETCQRTTDRLEHAARILDECPATRRGDGT
jgi:hypothetical protein